jgi:hypothetical protein
MATRLGLHDSMRRFSTNPAAVANPLHKTSSQSIALDATPNDTNSAKQLVN